MTTKLKKKKIKKIQLSTKQIMEILTKIPTNNNSTNGNVCSIDFSAIDLYTSPVRNETDTKDIGLKST